MRTRIFWATVFTLVVVNAACSRKDVSGQSGTAAAPAAASKMDGKNLEALVDLIVAEAAELPRAEFDPTALAKSLGSDPQKHFEWVRDRTWWAPYRGLLRGSKGVMLDRVGSNLDRAVLLGDLLRRSGHTVRLAHAQLPESRARELLAKVRPMPAERRNSAVEKPIAAERKRKLESIVPGYEQLAQQESAQAAKLSTEAASLVRSQADRLSVAVRSAAAEDGADDRKAIASMRDHWWVERQEDGRWIAMDVLLADAKQDDTLAAASSIGEWKSTDAAPAIPASDWHTVQVRVIFERYENGATSESTALESTLRPAEVIDQPVTLRHLPDPWPQSLPDPKTDPNALGNTAVNVKQWVPYLRIGEKVVAQSAVTDAGNLETSPFGAKNDISETGGASIMGGADLALGGGETPSSYMTAEWIEYVIHVPGQEDERLRRPVFDLLGPVRRVSQASGFDGSRNNLMVERYEALLSSTDILVQPCDFTSEFVSDLRLAGIVANQDDIRKLLMESDRAKAQDLALTIHNRIARWGPLPDLALWRSLVGSKAGDRFIDRPNVLNYRITRPVVAADRAPTRELIDVASNGMGVRRGGDPFATRLHQGVADTIVEMLILTDDLRSMDNTASVFMGEETGFEGSTLIRPRDSEAVMKLGWPEDVTARLSSDVAAGYLAVVPGKAALIDGKERLAWWRVDPASGETIGVMDSGFHAAMTERTYVDRLMETIGLRLQQYERAERAWAATARDFITRPGVTSLSPEGMQRLVVYTRIVRTLGEMGLALL